MMDFVFSLDRELLVLINRLPHNFVSNGFFLFFSIAGYYGFIWFALTFLMFIYDRLDNRREIIALVLAVIFELVLVEGALKNIFGRVRPDLTFDSYSFPSGHATIAFASAYILSRQRKNISLFFYLLAFFVAISRVYLGKHYPSDVLVGSILGFIVGRFAYIICEKLFVNNNRKKYEKT